MNSFISILLILFSLVLEFCAGFLYGQYRERNETSSLQKNSYDSGWNDCMKYLEENYEIIRIDEMLDGLEKEQKSQILFQRK